MKIGKWSRGFGENADREIKTEGFGGDGLLWCGHWDKTVASQVVGLTVASVNSYAKHCKDPVAAAESDLLGRALEIVRELLAIQMGRSTGKTEAIAASFALLAETNGGA